MNNYKILGVTGNRPHKLPPNNIVPLKKRINEICYNFANAGGELLIQGAALGTDTWFAQAALDNNLPYHNYIPFPQQADDWNITDKNTYQHILNNSARNIIFGDKPNNKYYFERNAAIVDNSDIMVVVHGANVNNGGAIWTMNYALNNNKPVMQIIVYDDYIINKWIPNI